MKDTHVNRLTLHAYMYVNGIVVQTTRLFFSLKYVHFEFYAFFDVQTYTEAYLLVHWILD